MSHGRAVYNLPRTKRLALASKSAALPHGWNNSNPARLAAAASISRAS